MRPIPGASCWLRFKHVCWGGISMCMTFTRSYQIYYYCGTKQQVHRFLSSIHAQQFAGLGSLNPPSHQINWNKEVNALLMRERLWAKVGCPITVSYMKMRRFRADDCINSQLLSAVHDLLLLMEQDKYLSSQTWFIQKKKKILNFLSIT